LQEDGKQDEEGHQGHHDDHQATQGNVIVGHCTFAFFRFQTL
jgi:hypothetical protein